MEQDKNKETAQPTQTNIEKPERPGQGRQPENESQTPIDQSDDISDIDQQEGHMNNGRLGGNFDAP